MQVVRSYLVAQPGNVLLKEVAMTGEQESFLKGGMGCLP